MTALTIVIAGAFLAIGIFIGYAISEWGDVNNV